jgi:TP901 family phage tail tape measure protein
MADLGRAYFQLVPSMSGFSAVVSKELSGLGTTQGATVGKQFSSGFQQSISGLNTKVIGGGLIAAGAGIAAALGGAVKVSADFQQGISNIGAVSGASAAQMGQIRDAALRIGKDTAFSASEAAGAMEELVKAGVPIPAVLGGAADATVALAASTGIAMPEAATLASNAMNQFGLSAKALPGVVDTIAGAANASAIDASQFGLSLSQVGAVAKSSGLSFGETATAIAELGRRASSAPTRAPH